MLQKKSGFTLVELLVVIGVITILASLLLPALQNVTYTARNVSCMNRVAQLAKATTQYCQDNRGWFVDRGRESVGTDPGSVARWAGRVKANPGSSAGIRIDDAMDAYIPVESPTFCCPLYQGDTPTSYNGGSCVSGLYGCRTHGIAHIDGYGYMTYGFYGGLNEWDDWGVKYNPGGRWKLGKPFMIEDGAGNTIHRSGLLIADQAHPDNAWVPAFYPGPNIGLFGGYNTPGVGVTAMHRPRPGVSWERLWQGHSLYAASLLAVHGPTTGSYAFDDGSAVTRTIYPEGALTDSKWTPIGPTSGRYMMFPNR